MVPKKWLSSPSTMVTMDPFQCWLLLRETWLPVNFLRSRNLWRKLSNPWAYHVYEQHDGDISKKTKISYHLTPISCITGSSAAIANQLLLTHMFIHFCFTNIFCISLLVKLPWAFWKGTRPGTSVGATPTPDIPRLTTIARSAWRG